MCKRHVPAAWKTDSRQCTQNTGNWRPIWSLGPVHFLFCRCPVSHLHKHLTWRQITQVMSCLSKGLHSTSRWRIQKAHWLDCEGSGWQQWSSCSAKYKATSVVQPWSWLCCPVKNKHTHHYLSTERAKTQTPAVLDQNSPTCTSSFYHLPNTHLLVFWTALMLG